MKAEDFFSRLDKDSPEFKAAWALEEPRMRVAANVYRLRTRSGLTQSGLAERAGMRQPRVAELERGDSSPNQDTLVRIALALGVDIAELYQRVETLATTRTPRKTARLPG
jgi:transcriptional regulator with XRE-family HTH domain